MKDSLLSHSTGHRTRIKVSCSGAVASASLLLLALQGCGPYLMNCSGSTERAGIDYHLEDDRFVPIDYFSMISGQLTKFEGKYVVFEGYFSGIFPDPLVQVDGRKRKVADLQAFYVREKKHSVRHVRVVYPDAHQEDVIPLVSLNLHRSRLKVFAYVLLEGQHPFLKNKTACSPFDEALIWLVEVRVLDDGGVLLQQPRKAPLSMPDVDAN